MARRHGGTRMRASRESLETGFVASPDARPGEGVRVLHVLDHSLPEQSGYAFRSHAILSELGRLGVDVDVITGPKQGVSNADAEQVDGIVYRRTRLGANQSTSGVRGQIRTVRTTRAHLAEFLGERPIDVIHAHSPCLNGLAALGRNVPLLYEMRSSWEDAAASVGTTREGSLRYRASKALETHVVRRADEVVVICDGLKQELMGRGVSEEKITVVPNALPPEMFDTASVDQTAAMRKRFGLQEAKVVGFFGSFFEWEGLDLLIKAMPTVVAAVPSARLLLAGGGRQEEDLRRLVEKEGLENRVVFAGRVRHEEVRALYRSADVMAYPRVSHRLTDMVTPLKPLESMAQMTPVVASAVGGHRELIEDGRTGYLFLPGDRMALARSIIRVLVGPEELGGLVATARQVVERERRWSVVAERYLPVYERLVRRHGSGVQCATEETT